jgi:hypothetical protein
MVDLLRAEHLPCHSALLNVRRLQRPFEFQNISLLLERS